MISSAQEFANLRTSGHPEEQARAAHDHADEAVWLNVIACYPDLKIWVARNKTVPLSVLYILANCPEPDVRREVAVKRKLDEALFRQLATDPDERVRLAILNNAKCPADVRKMIEDLG